MKARRIPGLNKQWLALWASAIAIILLAMAMHYHALPQRSMTLVKAVNTGTYDATFPSLIGHRDISGKTIFYSFQLNYDNWPAQQTGFQIIPNGCVREILVNGKPFPFRGSNWCNPTTFSHWNPYIRPMYLDLAPALKSGNNTILIKSNKAEFSMGPVILYHNLKLPKWIGLLMALATCIALFKIMQLHNRENISGYIMAAGFLVHLQRFSQFGVMERAMDMPGHLSYITHIAHKLQWPNPYAGWSYYHPPLYYTLEAAVMRYANWLGTFDPITLMQLFSMGCFIIFLIFSAMCLHLIIRCRPAYYIALVLLVFYPSGILFSSHIDSHMLLYASYAACIYFTLRWLENNQNRNLGIALMFVGIAIATRTNALILLPLVGLAFLYNAGRGKVSASILKSNIIRAGLIVLCLGFAMNFGRIGYYQVAESRHEPLLVGNIFRLSAGLRIGNDNLLRMLTPNIPHYVTHPFWSVWGDADGRQFFWNSMLKSSLTGEYSWDMRSVALYMGNALLAIIFYIIDAYIIHRQALRMKKEWSLCMIGLFIPVAALFANRWFFPFACSEDFRYIYPALAAFCGLMGLALEQHLKDWRPFRAALGMGLCLFFAYCAVRFYST